MCLLLAGMVFDGLKALLELRPNRSSHYCLQHSFPLKSFLFPKCILIYECAYSFWNKDASLLFINFWTVFVVALSYNLLMSITKTSKICKICFKKITAIYSYIFISFWKFRVHP